MDNNASEKNQEAIYLDSAGKLKWASDGVWPWLSFYFNHSKFCADLPKPMTQWIRASRQAAVASEIATAHPFCVLWKGRKRLLVRFAEDNPRYSLLFLTEEKIKSGSGEEVREEEQPGFNRLTRRESEVLRWITIGKTNAETAIILGLSSRTVDKHAQNIFRKLRVKSRAAAMLRMMEQG